MSLHVKAGLCWMDGFNRRTRAAPGTMEPPALQPRQRGYNAGDLQRADYSSFGCLRLTGGICTVGLPQASGYTMVAWSQALRSVRWPSSVV